MEFTLPEASWSIEMDTAFDTGEPPAGTESPSGTYKLEGRSVALLRQQ